MRKVVAGYFVSLDGVAESANEFMTAWDDVVDASIAKGIADQDAAILGRRSYDEWAGFWPTSDIEPFSSFINPVTKYVATSSPLTQEWANTQVIEGDVVDFVRDLKNQPGGVIGVHASISIAQALLTGGLLDELSLVIAPTVVGRGKRLLDGIPATRLELISGETSPSGYFVADYRVIH